MPERTYETFLSAWITVANAGEDLQNHLETCWCLNTVVNAGEDLQNHLETICCWYNRLLMPKRTYETIWRLR